MNFHDGEKVYVKSVHLIVEDVTRSSQFYQQVLGFKVLAQTDMMIQLTADGINPLLTIEGQKESQGLDPGATGLYHFALLLPERSDLANFLRHLISENIQVAGSDHFVSEAVYFSDPDGNGIEVYIDRPSEAWVWKEGQVKMTVDPLDFNGLIMSAEEKGWGGIPPETLLGHIHLHVSDLSNTEEYYCNGLGFDVVSRFGDQALFISSGGYHHHIGLNTWKGTGAPPPDKNSRGLRSFDIIYPNDPLRQAAVDRLRKMDAWIQEEGNIIMTRDPSANYIRLQV
ncbi:VOC family protein [Halobacillus sp. H74]|uniref:VOC family protein n=1 Tax=Halobacillus sp. H74 TaxID=3457436 RepID=UPI003FCE0708